MSGNNNDNDAIKSIVRLRKKYSSAISKKQFKKVTGVVNVGGVMSPLQRKNYVEIGVGVFCALAFILFLLVSLLVYLDKIDTGDWDVTAFVLLSILFLFIGLYQIKRMRRL